MSDAGTLPARVTDWVASTIGSRARVVHVRALPGATSSSVHAVDVDDSLGHIHRLVLRRYVRAEVLASEPGAVGREATILDVLTGSSVPAPRLVAVDADGSACDVPALLMTRLPGRPRTRPRDLDQYLERLAAPLEVIHSVALLADDRFPEYHPYAATDELTPPTWSAHPHAWERAIERHASGPPTFEPVLIHRDYHPRNILWSAGRVSGVVDWAWACNGPAAVDIAHCRLNLTLGIGLEAADRFLSAVTARTAYDPAWDLLDAVDALPDLHDSRAALRRLDEFVARAVGAAGIS